MNWRFWAPDIGCMLICLSMAASLGCKENRNLPPPSKPIRLAVGMSEQAMLAALDGSGAKRCRDGRAGNIRLVHLTDLGSNCRIDLQNRKLSASIRKSFEEVGHPLSQDTYLVDPPAFQEDGSWTLVDEKRKRKYSIVTRRSGESLQAFLLPDPFWQSSTWLLDNGMVLCIQTNREWHDKPASISGLSVCNTKSLLAPHKATWYNTSRVSVDGRIAKLVGLPGDEGGIRSRTSTFVHKGMPNEQTLLALVNAEAKPLRIERELTRMLPDRGHWKQYTLKNRHKLLINYMEHEKKEVVALLVLEDNPPEGRAVTRIECELLDLKVPVKPGWNHALDPALHWSPDQIR